MKELTLKELRIIGDLLSDKVINETKNNDLYLEIMEKIYYNIKYIKEKTEHTCKTPEESEMYCQLVEEDSNNIDENLYYPDIDISEISYLENDNLRGINIKKLSVHENKDLCDEFGGDLTHKELVELISFLGMKKNKTKIIRSIEYIKEIS